MNCSTLSNIIPNNIKIEFIKLQSNNVLEIINLKTWKLESCSKTNVIPGILELNEHFIFHQEVGAFKVAKMKVNRSEWVTFMPDPTVQ